MKGLQPITDHEELARTPHGAVINIDDKAYKNALSRAEAAKRIYQHDKDIRQLKEDMDEIKDLLKSIKTLVGK